jgi:CRP-like cAMP-binding protein
MDNQLRSFLKSFTGLPDETIGEIILKFKFITTKRNQILEEASVTCKKLYFIKSGCLRLYEIDKKGKDITAYFSFENSMITALPSLITQKPSRDYLVSLEPCELMVISREHFFEAVEKYPAFRLFYNKIVEFAFIHSQMRIYSFLGMEGMDKLKWVIEHEPQLLNRVSSKAVASYLGMTSSTLSKLRAKM